MDELEPQLASIDATEPVVLEAVDDPGPEPPHEGWDAGAHVEEDVREGVELTERADG